MSKADTFVTTFMMHRNVLQEVIDLLSDKDIDYRPWDGAMSTGDLIGHILTAGYMFANAAATGKAVAPSEKPTFKTVSDIKEAYETWTEKTVSAIQGMSDDQFEATVDTTKLLGRELPASVMLHSMRDHEIHHKGQLFVYVRMCGIEKVPFFVKMK